MIKRYNKEIVVFLLLGLVLLTFKRQYGYYEVYKNIENKEFNGIVDGITKGSRGAPVFILSGQEISLGGYGYNLKHHLNIGDSVFKHDGTSNVVIIKYFYHDTITVDVLDNLDNNIVISNKDGE